MTKKQAEGTNDSDELQALFDSIASVPEADTPSAEAAHAASVETSTIVDDGKDNPDLQALFDATLADSAVDQVPIEGIPSVEEIKNLSDNEKAAVFNRLGRMTRHVHDTLRALGSESPILGSESPIYDSVNQIPDARERLNYISQMTEQAASRVLNATDIAKPLQDNLVDSAQSLGIEWDKVFANELTTEQFKVLVQNTRAFIEQVQSGAKHTNEQLMEIIMAQDFQDLTGQVIKKVIELAQKLESELLGVLIEVAPDDLKKSQLKPGSKELNSLMNGPVINAENRDDVVTTQEQVDDLLDSLGF